MVSWYHGKSLAQCPVPSAPDDQGVFSGSKRIVLGPPPLTSHHHLFALFVGRPPNSCCAVLSHTTTTIARPACSARRAHMPTSIDSDRCLSPSTACPQPRTLSEIKSSLPVFARTHQDSLLSGGKRQRRVSAPKAPPLLSLNYPSYPWYRLPLRIIVA
jgi:hypothetical protein